MIQLIADKYVDSIDIKKLVENGIEGIISQLDPHTVYIPKEDLTRVNEELEGEFYGIGVEFYLNNDTIHIASILTNGPADHTELQAGDQIIQIDDSIVSGKQLTDEEVIKRIRGNLNTEVKLVVLHPNKVKATCILNRGIVPYKSVVASVMLTPTIGYIKIRLFSETTFTEFKTALEQLIKRHAQKLIIDVRDNPGGYMEAVSNIADELIAGNKNLITTKGNHETDIRKTSNLGLFEKGDLAILVNEGSASASEILSGVIQDLDRGIVIGRRTFGKGLVQEQFELPDGSALRITTARYYLPSGRCIQKSYAKGKEEYSQDIIRRFHNGQLSINDSTHAKPEIFYTALKRKVYGGEGITPDIFVPLDTTYDASLEDFYATHAVEEYAHRYYFFHKNEFTTYTNLDLFSRQFSISKTMMDDLYSYTKSLKINTNGLQQTQLVQKLQSLLRAEFAKLLFQSNGHYLEMSKDDTMIKLALKKLNVMQ